MNSCLGQESCNTTQRKGNASTLDRMNGTRASSPQSAATITACEAGPSVTQRLSDNFVKRKVVLSVSTMSSTTSPVSWHARSTPLAKSSWSSSASKSATSWSMESANQRAWQEAICFGVSGSLKFKRSAIHCPRYWYMPETLLRSESTVTYALRSKPGSLNWRNSDQRDALCTSCAAQPSITNSVKRNMSVGKPGDRPSRHGASAACTCRQMRSKADSANRSNCTIPVRTPHGPIVVQSSNLSRGPPQWHEHFFTCVERHGDGDRQHALPHAHLVRCTARISARQTPSDSPCEGRPYLTATATRDA